MKWMQSLHVDVTAGKLRFLMLWLPRKSDIFGLSESCHGPVNTSIPISNPVPTTWSSPITANFVYLYIIVSTSPVTMDRPDVVLIGNSFIRRLRDNYVARKWKKTGQSRLWEPAPRGPVSGSGGRLGPPGDRALYCRQWYLLNRTFEQSRNNCMKCNAQHCPPPCWQ